MEKQIGKIFAHRLKELMAVRPDLDTQVKLAKVTGMSQTTIGRILKSRVSPTLEHVGSIADAFGMSIGEMVGSTMDKSSLINYDRKAYARLTDEQKKAIESYIHHQICHHAAVKPRVVVEQRTDNRRKEDTPWEDGPEKRTMSRREQDSLYC